MREVEKTKTHTMTMKMKELSDKKIDFCLSFLDTLEQQFFIFCVH